MKFDEIFRFSCCNLGVDFDVRAIFLQFLHKKYGRPFLFRVCSLDRNYIFIVFLTLFKRQLCHSHLELVLKYAIYTMSRGHSCTA